ncbi:MAG TPA: hypothetical protein VMR52_00910 [Dehalococcoidia bacterium]|nr:hypothetical protein [Dehalococcoidia bacterium]
MPVASSIRELIDALQTKKTKTMCALDDLFGSAEALAALQTHPQRGELSNPDVLNTLPGWAVEELKGRGISHRVQQPLSDEEIQHINDWPAENKRALVGVLDAAITNQQPLEFFWELHGDETEGIDTSQAGRVFFRSPQRNVEVGGTFIFVADLLADVKVHVGQKR